MAKSVSLHDGDGITKNKQYSISDIEYKPQKVFMGDTDLHISYLIKNDEGIEKWYPKIWFDGLQ